ncbi:MAG: hypothetical protein JXN61_15990 [Sedimentisphaerales bacterium]|nr:hypothetical protein [Sedimentisphaerales bacterium]
MEIEKARLRSLIAFVGLPMLALVLVYGLEMIDSTSYAAKSEDVKNATPKGTKDEAKEEANRGLYKASDPVDGAGFDVMETEVPAGKTLEVEQATAKPVNPGDAGAVMWDGNKENPTKFTGRKTGWAVEYDVEGILKTSGEGEGEGDPEEWFSHFDAKPDDPRIRLEINGSGDDDNTVLMGDNDDALTVTIVDGAKDGSGNPISYTVILSCEGRDGEEGNVTFDGTNETLTVTLTSTETVDLKGTVSGKMKINGHCSEAADHSVDGEVAGDAIVTSVTFTGAATKFKTVRKDDNTANYPTPHWQKGRTVQSPACYVKDTAMEVDVALSAPTLSNGDIWVKGTADGVEGGIAFTSKKGQINNGVATVNDIVAATNLPDSIYCFDPMTISWEYSTDETNWFPAGSSVNQVYVTLGEPQTTVFHTLVHIGCKKAEGKSTPGDAVRDIWKEFEDLYVLRVDGQLLKYYGSWTVSGFTTAALLANGDSRCGGWMRFMHDILSVQNIPSTEKKVVPVNSMALLVKSWSIPGAGGTSGVPNYPFLNVLKTPPILNTSYNWTFQVEAPDRRGIAGQGNSDPISTFSDHAILLYDGQYYDPSYGDTYTGLNDMETKSISGYYMEGQVILPPFAGMLPAMSVGSAAVDQLKFSP